MTNAIITMVLAGAVVFVLAAVTDPRMGKWLASVLYARALAVEAGREKYRVVRNSGIVVGTTVYTGPGK